MNRSLATLLIAATCVAVGAVAISLGRPVPEHPAASVLDAGSRASIATRWSTRVDTLHRGEPLAAVLERAGVSRDEATRALRSTSSFNERAVRAGTTVETKSSPDSGAREIVFHLAIDRLVHLRRSADAWTAEEERLPWKIDTVAVGGLVRTSMNDALARGASAFPANVRLEVSYALAEILEHRVDLSRDLQPGDTVSLLVERKTAPNGTVINGDILASRLTVDGKRVEAMRFASSNTGNRAKYFDGEGKSLNGGFLRAPLEFRRISSLFGMRKHPILGIVRAHQGIDYAAQSGTAVRAIGDGTVIFAGWKGGYGRVVEIRHRNGIVTRYGHLRDFAKGIRGGVSVAMSNTIGHVGASGLATAPHLHFEVLVRGVHQNPNTALKSSDSGEPLATPDKSAFASLRARLFSHLDSLTSASTFIAQTAAPAGRSDPTRHVGDE